VLSRRVSLACAGILGFVQVGPVTGTVHHKPAPRSTERTGSARQVVPPQLGYCLGPFNGAAAGDIPEAIRLTTPSPGIGAAAGDVLRRLEQLDELPSHGRMLFNFFADERVP